MKTGNFVNNYERRACKKAFSKMDTMMNGASRSLTLPVLSMSGPVTLSTKFARTTDARFQRELEDVGGLFHLENFPIAACFCKTIFSFSKEFYKTRDEKLYYYNNHDKVRMGLSLHMQNIELTES